MTAPNRATPHPHNSLEDRIRTLPGGPGVYWMLDRRGQILYVGKATHLRSRVQSHFHVTGKQRQKVHKSLRRVKDIHWMATATESEALVLEASLIRLYDPVLNVARPAYWFLRLTVRETYPRLEVVREMADEDGCRYFGPYPDAGAVFRLYRALPLLFRVRPGASRCPWDGGALIEPCHYLEFGWCSAPCAGGVDLQQYKADVESLTRFLQASAPEQASTLRTAARHRLEAAVQEEQRLALDQEAVEREMNAAARRLDFERAATLRDTRFVIERCLVGARERIRKLKKQMAGLGRAAEVAQVIQPGLPDLDLWAVGAQEDVLGLAVLPFRSGRLHPGVHAFGCRVRLLDCLRVHYRRVGPPPLILYAVFDGASGTLVESLNSEEVFSGEKPTVAPAASNQMWAGAVALGELNLKAALEAGRRSRRSSKA